VSLREASALAWRAAQRAASQSVFVLWNKVPVLTSTILAVIRRVLVSRGSHEECNPVFGKMRER
jgi:hypothetical protein